MKELISKRIIISIFLFLSIILLIGCAPTRPEPTPGEGSPTITSKPLSTTVNINELYAYSVKATDPDGDTLIYSLIKKPSGMFINSETGLIKWRPKSNQVGVHDVMIKVTDGINYATQSFKITVPGFIDTALKITSKPVTSVTVGALYTYQVTTNYKGDESLVFTLTESPAGMVIDVDTGLITWTPNTSQIDTFDVMVEVTDGEEVAEQSFTVTVNDILDSITVLPETMEIFAYQSKTVDSVTASYKNTPDKPINLSACSYKTSNKAIATISAVGTITGVATGTATITVSYTEGSIIETDTVEVTVKPRELASIAVTPKSMALKIGQSKNITSVTASYNYGPTKNIPLASCDYVSGATGIATVSNAGKITGIAGGITDITVTYTEGSIAKTDKVAVSVDLPNLKLTPASQTVALNKQVTINVVVEDVTNLQGASITLNFDATKLQYKSRADGEFIPNATIQIPNLDNDNGIVTLDIAGLGLGSYNSGTGTIMTVTFSTASKGKTDITLNSTQLRDNNNDEIPHTKGSGCSVTIS